MASPATSKALKRLNKELTVLGKKPIEYATIEASCGDVKIWVVTIRGPADSPYKDGYFKVEFAFPEQYPMKPPDVRFLTKIYHPNVSTTTLQVCQDSVGVGDKWSPTLKASYVIGKIYEMLQTPNGETPIDAEVGEVFNTKIEEFNKTATSWTKKFAAKC